MQQIQRYDKLNQVLSMLQRAREGQQREEEGEVKLSDLKQHIKTALDEAIRLRADTEVLKNRAKVSYRLIFVCVDHLERCHLLCAHSLLLFRMCTACRQSCELMGLL